MEVASERSRQGREGRGGGGGGHNELVRNRTRDRESRFSLNVRGDNGVEGCRGKVLVIRDETYVFIRTCSESTRGV